MNNYQMKQKLSSLFEAANSYLNTDPNASILKIGIFGEVLTVMIAKQNSIDLSQEFDQRRRLIRLVEKSAIAPETASYLHRIRRSRNQAIHVDLDGNFNTDSKSAEEAINNAKFLIRLYPVFQQQEAAKFEKSPVREAKAPPQVHDKFRTERIIAKDNQKQKSQQKPKGNEKQGQSFSYSLEEYNKAIKFLEELKKRDNFSFQMLYPQEYLRICDLGEFFDGWKKGFSSELEAAIEYLRFMGEDDLI